MTSLFWILLICGAHFSSALDLEERVRRVVEDMTKELKEDILESIKAFVKREIRIQALGEDQSNRINSVKEMERRSEEWIKIIKAEIAKLDSRMKGFESKLASAEGSSEEISASGLCTTTTGKKCHFPFIYKNVQYNECTYVMRGFYKRERGPWCGLGYDGLRTWHYCDTSNRNCPIGDPALG